MNSMRLAAALAAGLLATVAAPAIEAQEFKFPMQQRQMAAPPARPDFTFRVPVRLESIMPDTRARIHCRALEGSTRGDMVHAELIQDVPLDANGNYSGTVVVSGNASSEERRVLVDNWQCTLELQGPGSSRHEMPCFGASPTCPAWKTPKEGTPRRLFVNGRF